MPLHLIERLAAHPSKAAKLQFLQGTPRLISYCIFKNTCLWDWQTGTLIAEFDETYQWPIVPPAKDRFIIQQTQYFQVFESQAGKSLYKLPKREEGIYYNTVFVGNSKLVSNHDRVLYVWNWKTKKFLRGIPGLGGEDIWKVLDSDHIVTRDTWREKYGPYGGSDYFTILSGWNIDTGQRVWHFEGGRTKDRQRDISEVHSTAMSVDGKTLMLGSDFGWLMLLDYRTGRIIARPEYDGFGGQFMSNIVPLSDGKRVLLGSPQKMSPFLLVSLENFDHVALEWTPFIEWDHKVSYGLIRQETALAVATWYGNVHVFSLDEPHEILRTRLDIRKDFLKWSKVIHDGAYYVLVTNKGRVDAISLKTGYRKIKAYLKQSVAHCKLVQQEKRLVVFTKNGDIVLFSLENWREEARLTLGASVKFGECEVAPDDSSIAFSTEDGAIYFLRIE
jgi:hypothetical protein